MGGFREGSGSDEDHERCSDGERYLDKRDRYCFSEKSCMEKYKRKNKNGSGEEKTLIIALYFASIHKGIYMIASFLKWMEGDFPFLFV